MSGSPHDADLFWGKLNLGNGRKPDNCRFCQFWPLGIVAALFGLCFLKWLFGF